MRVQRSGQTKLKIKDTAFESCHFLSFFPPPFNSAFQIFQRERRQSPAYKPLSVSLVDMSALWGGLRILHILNRSRIFIDWTKLVCTSFMKTSVFAMRFNVNETF